MFKKLLCVLLAVLTLFSVSSVNSYAMSYETEIAEAESYESDGEYSESGILTKDRGDISWESFKQDMEDLGGSFATALFSFIIFGIPVYGILLLSLPIGLVGYIKTLF